jgi:hypothetical protein
VVRESARQGEAGQAGAASVRPTSTIFADAGAAQQAATASVAAADSRRLGRIVWI